MPIDRQNLKKNLVCAWEKAREKRAGADNRCRARIWVNAVGESFRTNYPEPYRVFWRGEPKEVLFDVMVCSIDTTKSLEPQPRPLEFIACCHWQVESEFGNTRELVCDMSKLVAGSATHKLMIAAHRKTKEKSRALLCRCAKIAARCGGEVYFCFVDHPQEWDSRPKGPALYEYTAEGWKELR